MSECVLLGLAFLIGWWTGVPPFGRFELDFRAVLLGGAATLPMLAALRWCLATTWAPMRRLIALVVEHLSAYLAGASAGGILLLSVMAGIGEEALFRGVIQTGLAQRIPGPAAVAVGGAALRGRALAHRDLRSARRPDRSLSGRAVPADREPPGSRDRATRPTTSSR